MKKQLFALILVLILALSMITGCSSDSGSSSSSSTTTDTSTEDTSSDESASGASDATVDALTIKFSSTYQETETGGVILKHFMDKVSELSDGAITVNMSWGGTLFQASDELDAIMDGSVNMVALAHMPHLNSLNYLAFPSFAPGDSAAALNYFSTIMFDDPETSALVQAEATDLGIKYLNVIAGGANAFCSKTEFTDLDSLVSGSSAFGNMDAAIFEQLGFKVTVIFPPDVYDGLNRGLIDSTQMALAPMVAMSWFEPAPYWALDGTYAAGNFFTVNLDWWEGLTPAQQEIIETAATDTQEYSGTLFTDSIATDIATVEEKTGQSFVELSDADIDKIWAAVFEAKAASALELAETSGKTEGMITILEKAAEITNYTWEH